MPSLSKMRAAVLLLILTVAGFSAASARADDPTAEDLFKEGVSLFERGEIGAACERFERSYKLDAAPGTLFNLAGCHERQGRLGQARLEYLDLVERATAAGKPDKAKLSREHLLAVEQRLPKLALVFPPRTNVMSILVDQSALAEGAWHDLVPVERGEHVVEFRAPGKTAVRRTLTTSDASVTNVEVPVLAPEGVFVAPSPAPVTPQSTASSGNGSRRVVAYVVGSIGLVGLGVGTYLAIHASSARSDANAACGGSDGVCPTPGDTAAAQRLAAPIVPSEVGSGIAFGLGAAAVATGVVLVVAGSSGGGRQGGIRLTPGVAKSGAGLSLSGRF
jgi:hypothetical protein